MPHVFSCKNSSIVDFITEQKEGKIESLYDVGRAVHWTSLEGVVDISVDIQKLWSPNLIHTL